MIVEFSDITTSLATMCLYILGDTSSVGLSVHAFILYVRVSPCCCVRVHACIYVCEILYIKLCMHMNALFLALVQKHSIASKHVTIYECEPLKEANET